MKNIISAATLLILGTTTGQAQYTFGSQVQSTPSANITYNSQSGVFTYTDSANSSDDSAYVPLTGAAATSINTSQNWTATLDVNLSGATLTRPRDEFPQFGIGLAIVSGDDVATINLAQDNNTGGTSNSDVPSDVYGTLAEFEVDDQAGPELTTSLNGNSTYNGTTYKQLSGGMNSMPSMEAIAAAMGVVTLSFNATTDVLTGSYDGVGLGSINLTDFGTDPNLTLSVVGFSGEGIAVTSGMDTANAFVIPEPSSVWMLITGGLVFLVSLRTPLLRFGGVKSAPTSN